MCTQILCDGLQNTGGMGTWVGCAGPWTGQGSIPKAGWISGARWKAGGSGRNEVGRDEVGRASGRNAGRRERQWLEQVREVEW